MSGIRALGLAFRCIKVQAWRRRVPITAISTNLLNRLHCILAAVCLSPPFPFDGRRGCRTAQRVSSEAAPPPDVGLRPPDIANLMPADPTRDRRCCGCGGSTVPGAMISDIFDIMANAFPGPASAPLPSRLVGRIYIRLYVTKMANPETAIDIFAYGFTPKSAAADRTGF